jgi:hypothetical protein
VSAVESTAGEGLGKGKGAAKDLTMRWMRCGGGALLGVLALLLLATPASGSLDEWSPADIRQFFLDHADCDIAVERIVDSGLIVDDLFDGRLDHEVLEKDLGVSSHIQRKRVRPRVCLRVSVSVSVRACVHVRACARVSLHCALSEFVECVPTNVLVNDGG